MPPALTWHARVAIILIAIFGFGAVAQAQTVRPEVVAAGLQNPWALAFLPQGRFLVTERPGRMRVVEANGQLGAPLPGLPAIDAGGQGGLLDVVTDANFVANRRLYFCFSVPAASGGGNSTAAGARHAGAGQQPTRIPKDNPFVGQAGALPEIWSYGHRNMQGATLAPDGTY